MNKPPAFQFYPNDWLGSPSIMLMTPAQEGAYIRLLAIAWNAEDCGLPDDDDALATLSRLKDEWFNGGSTVVRKCFVLRDGRLYNERLLRERQKQAKWRKKSSEGGKKGAKTREQQRLAKVKGGSTTVSRVVQPNGNSSSSSSSSSSDTPETTPVSPSKKFQKPTVEQLTEHAERKGWATFDPAEFLDYYESNGWMVGRNAMKSWPHAASKWNRNAAGYSRKPLGYVEPGERRPDGTIEVAL